MGQSRDKGYSSLSFNSSGVGVMRRQVVCPVVLRPTANSRISSSGRSKPSSTAGLCVVN